MQDEPGNRASTAKRSDAARNRARLITAAREVFAEQGYDVALEEIARAANVSRTTLYRNFPTREELAATIYAEGLGRIEQRAAELEGSPFGVVDLFDFVLDLQASDRAIAPEFSRSDATIFADMTTRTAAAFEPLVEAGLRAGVLRPGIGLHELLLATSMFEVSAGVDDRALRTEQHARSRLILRHGLFTDNALAAWKPPSEAVAPTGGVRRAAAKAHDA